MFGMGAVSDDERLDAEQAKQVLRRAARLARPFRRTIAAALGFVAISTLGVLLGPVMVRFGIDQGIAGAVFHSGQTQTGAEIVALADQGLYMAKNRGGDQICAASSSERCVS